MQNSLVLVRDGITATFFIGVFYFFINRKYLLFSLFLAGLFYLRITSGLLTIVWLIFYMYYFGYGKKTLKYIFMVAVLSFFAMPLLLTNLKNTGVLESGIFRQEFFETIKDYSESTSGAVFIYGLPAYLRIPLGTLYFISTPLINLERLLTSDRYTLWKAFDLLYGLAFMVYSIYLSKAFFVARKKSILLFLLISFVALSMLFSQISLQIRHKTMIMPLVFIIVAISFSESPLKRNQMLVILIPFIFITLEVIFNLWKLSLYI